MPWGKGVGGPQQLIRRFVFLGCAKNKGCLSAPLLCSQRPDGSWLPFITLGLDKDRVEEIAPGSLTRKEQLPDKVQPEKRLPCCEGIIHSGIGFLGRTSNVSASWRSSD